MEETSRYRAITLANVDRLPQWGRLPESVKRSVGVVARVLPFRTNQYVVDRLIDWDRVPDDPMFQLTFPQRGMLDPEHFSAIEALLEAGVGDDDIEAAADAIRLELNPHPAGQMTDNIPQLDGVALPGLQHKYAETVLFFPNRGQTCHAYCTFCFRWAQFVGPKDLRFGAPEVAGLIAYLDRHPEVSDVLFTGGDPMIMKTRVLRRYLEPLLQVETVTSIRIGTKAVAYWPQRFVSDDDAEDLLRLFEEVASAGKHLAMMGHYSHPVELSTGVAREAVRRIRSTGANVRMQSPVIRHVNDDAAIWRDLWRRGVQLGCVPYYMFVERDTGARRYFEVPLVECWEMYRRAVSKVSGLGRTVRGPSMSATPGKVRISGIARVDGQDAFVLEYLQARDPDLVGRPFFAAFDPEATWFDQLRPLRGGDERFFPHLNTRRRLAVEVGRPLPAGSHRGGFAPVGRRAVRRRRPRQVD